MIFPLNLSSDLNVSSNIVNKSSDGSRFTVICRPSITIPQNALNIYASVPTAKFWYTFKNISVAKNNNKIYLTDNVGIPSKYTITLDDGLYSLTQLNNAINYAVVALGLPSGTLTLVGDQATSKVIFTLITGYQLYFGVNSCYQLVGTNSLQKIPAGGLTTSTYSEKAPSVATFSSLTSVLFHCSLVSNSILNGRGSDVICSVEPEVSVGSLQVYRPYIPIKIPCPNLYNSKIDEITMYITDQNGNPLDTNGENYGLIINIEWDD